MGSSNNSKQTSQSQTSFDPDLKSAVLKNYAQAQDVAANNPMQPYRGPLSAGFDGTPLDSAQGAYGALASYASPDINRSAIRTVTPGQLSTTDLAPYENPFTKDVVNATTTDLNRQYGIDSAAANGQATQAGAFGGSRSAVLSSLVNDNYQRNLNSTVAGLHQANFTQAQGAAGQDIANKMAADTTNAGYDASTAAANQNASVAAAGIRGGAASGLSTIAQAQQQQKQSGIMAAYQEWLRQQNYPIQLQQMLNQAAGLLPNGTVGTSTGTGGSSGFSIGPQSVSVSA